MGDASPTTPPRLRGVVHQYAFFVALVACAIMIGLAPAGRPRLAAAIYAAALCGLLGVSALYHRRVWTATRRRWMRRLDHSMIFVLVAATYTPFALLVLRGGLAEAVLVVVWIGVTAGIVLSLVYVDAPKWVSACAYLCLGWVGVATMPQLVGRAGPGALILILFGGALYSAGACVYALQRPNPRPGVFGYHEVFHALVVAAAAAHFVAVAVYALPRRG
jgi:hemolysin III